MPLQNMRHHNILEFWIKLLATNENKYIKVYLMLKQDIIENPNRITWWLLLKDLLCTIGFYEVWLNQTLGDSELFLYNMKQRLKGQFL
jgi:hypothetical protein